MRGLLTASGLVAPDTSVAAGPARLPRVDLLPPEIGARRRFRRVQAGLGGGVLAAFGVVALLHTAAAGSVADAEEQVQAAGATQRTVAAEVAQYRDVTATYQRAADAQALLVAAMGEEVRYSRLLSDLSLSVPDGVWVKSLAFTQGAAAAPAPAATALPGIGTVTVSGVAFEHEDVAGWLESLAGQRGYTAPLLQSSTEALIGSRRIVNFATTTALSPEALSRRYATPGR